MDPLKKKPRISIDDRLKFQDQDEPELSSEEEEMHTSNAKSFLHQRHQGFSQPAKMYPSLDEFKTDKTHDNSIPSHTESKSDAQKNKPGSDKNNYLVPFICIVIILFIFGSLIFWLSAAKQVYNADNLPILTDHIYSLGKSFPGQSESFWTAIVSGIKDFYTEQPQKPCIILLFGNIETKDTAECLVQEVANKVVRDIHKGSVKPAFLEAATIQHKDYGETLVNLRKTVASQKVLVIKNLQNMKGSVAESLHALCDRYNSAESEALILFTLHGAPYASNAAAIAQQILTEKWKEEVSSDKLPALVARITSRVVAVSTEYNLPNTCS